MAQAMEVDESTGARTRGWSGVPALAAQGDSRPAGAPVFAHRIPCFINLKLCGLDGGVPMRPPARAPFPESMAWLERE